MDRPGSRPTQDRGGVQVARALIDAYTKTIARIRILSRSTQQDVRGSVCIFGNPQEKSLSNNRMRSHEHRPKIPLFRTVTHQKELPNDDTDHGGFIGGHTVLAFIDRGEIPI